MRRFSVRAFPVLACSVVLWMSLLTGCGTLVSSVQTWPEPDWFGGVAYDSNIIRDPASAEDFPVFAIIDWPFSLVLDVGFLPFNFVFQVIDWVAGDDEAESR